MYVLIHIHACVCIGTSMALMVYESKNQGVGLVLSVVYLYD
jgi:hypothetical protein